MSDEVIVQEPVKVEATPFSGNSWTETLPEVKPSTEEIKPVVDAEGKIVETKPVVTEEIKIPVEWLKKEFEVEDPAILKAEREELKTLKAAKPVVEEQKFENEESKNLHELFRTGKWKEAKKIIDTQDRIAELVALEVDDSTAADIIKMGMQLKYKEQKLSISEIEYKYNKEFGLPKEPQPKDDDLDGEFEARKADWQERVNDIKMNRNIEAKLAKSELEKSKVNLVLPEIDKPTIQQANEPTPEELDKQKKWAENFLNTINSNYSKVEGFETKVKDELVEYPVSFKIPDEDKVAIKERLISGVDVNELMGKRWFSEKGEANVEQMSKDLYVLENLDKILSGVANKAASERLIQLRKTASNINVNSNSNQETFNPEQNGNSKVSPFGKDAWSEKPPTSINN